MNFFRKQQNGLLSSNDVTAIDGTVIARKGQAINDEFMDRVTSISPDGVENTISLVETPVFKNIEMLIEKPKYQFITNRGSKKDQLLKLLAPIRISNILLRELNWMDRFGYHHHHSLAVALLVSRMMMDYFEEEELAREAARSAIIHDVGITRVPEWILNKVSPLTPEERSELNEHPIYSYLLLSYYQGSHEEPSARVGFHHHENMVGSGYPAGTQQTDVVCQCIDLCDSYDALTSARPFHPAVPPLEALEIIQRKVDSNELDSLAFTMLNTYLHYVD